MGQHNGTVSSAMVDSAFGRLVEDLTTRLQAGEAVDWPAVADEHPDHADELAAIRPALEMLGHLSRAGDSAISGVATAPIDDDALTGVLGDFRLLREVGRGGMGVVYEAEQISLGRRVALKVLPYAGALDAKQLQRFKNEAKAAASLRHEHIVQVHAIGCERGVHFYAMEFIDGMTLAQVIAESQEPNPPTPFPKREGGEETGPEISPPSPGFAGEGLGVRAAVKPSIEPSPPAPLPQSQERGENTPTAPIAALSTQRGGPNKREFHRRAAELIADAADALEFAHAMGIVHRDVKPGNLMVDAAGKLWVADFGLARFGTDAGLTMSGDLLGTLRYMAPEQAMARHGLADHRVDIYGLGCTLYELLTGKPALVGEDKADILRHIAFEEPNAPRKLDKAIPAELETIALKCLAKEPRERYATAGELAADLKSFARGHTIKARPATPMQRIRRWALRHRAVVWAAALSGVVALTALGGSIGWVARERAERRADAERRAGDLLTESERLYGEGNFPEALSSAQNAEYVLTAVGAGGEMLERAQRAVENLRSDGSLAPFYDNIAMRKLGEGDLVGAAIAEREAIRIRPNWRWAYRHLGFILSEKRDWNGAEAAFREAIRLGDKSESNLGKALKNQGNLDAAIECFQAILRLDPNRGDPTKQMIECFNRKRDWDGLIADARASLGRGPSPWAYYQLSVGLRHKGDTEAATDECRQSLLLCRDYLRRSPEDQPCLLLEAEIYEAAWNKEVYDPKRAIEAARKYATVNPGAILAWEALARAHYRAADWAEAISAADRCIEIGGGFGAGNLVRALAYARQHKAEDARRAWDLARAELNECRAVEVQIDLWAEAEGLFGAITQPAPTPKPPP